MAVIAGQHLQNPLYEGQTPAVATADRRLGAPVAQNLQEGGFKPALDSKGHWPYRGQKTAFGSRPPFGDD